VELRRTLLALVGAAVLLAALGSAAAARNLSTTSQTLRAQFRELRFNFPNASTQCQVTIDGSFHNRTISKTPGTLSGFITRVTLGACATGATTILTETLPWHVRYQSFTGTLPNITAITAHVIGAALRIREVGGVNCLATTSATEPGIIRMTRDTVTGAITGAELSGTLASGFECLGTRGGFVSDNAPVTVSNSTARITISLI
jgi:hypothetical protein